MLLLFFTSTAGGTPTAGGIVLGGLFASFVTGSGIFTTTVVDALPGRLEDAAGVIEDGRCLTVVSS